MILDENAGIAELFEELRDGEIAVAVLDLLLGLAEEAQDVAHQLPVLGADDVAALTEQAIEVAARILAAALGDGDGKAHRGGGGFNAEMIEERGEIGVVLLVIDNEPGIDRHRAVFGLRQNGIGVAAEPGVFLENGNSLRTRQQPSS